METRHEESRAEELVQRMEGIITQLEEIKLLWKRRKREELRHRTRRHRASSRRRRGRAESNTLLKRNDVPIEVGEENEEGSIDLKVHNSEGIVKPVEHERCDGISRNVGNLFVAVKPETKKEDYVDEAKTQFAEVESEKNNDRGGRGRVTVKRDDGDEADNDEDDGDNDEDDGDEELPPAEPPPEELPEEAIDGGATMEEEWLVRDGGERLLCFAVFSDGEWKRKMGPEGMHEEEERSYTDGEAATTAPEEENATATVGDGLLARDLGSSLLSLEADTGDREWEERRMKVRLLELIQ